MYQTKLKATLLTASLLLIAHNTLAATNHYCAAGNRYINLGDTMQQVETACGKPTNVTKQAAAGPSVIWTYGLANRGSPRHSFSSSPFTNLPGNHGNQVSIRISNNKVTEITANGRSRSRLSTCRGRTIQIGSTAKAVQQSCGRPTYTNVVPGSLTNTATQVPTSIWTYQDPYGTTVTLEFKGEKLDKIDTGATRAVP